MNNEGNWNPPPQERSLGPEAVAFLLDLGICPGSECQRSRGGCDIRCHVLREWASDAVEG